VFLAFQNTLRALCTGSFRARLAISLPSMLPRRWVSTTSARYLSGWACKKTTASQPAATSESREDALDLLIVFDNHDYHRDEPPTGAKEGRLHNSSQ
jgi:hypothetical protein